MCSKSLRCCLLAFAASVLLTASQTRAQEAPDAKLLFPLRTQQISLQAGWNAVWLEVRPINSAPSQAFADTPIDLVAAWFKPITSRQFISDPADQPWKEAGWHVWYAPSREDSVLTSLHKLVDHQAYLIHCKSAFQWNVNGEVRFKRLRWANDAFNLVGFSVDAGSPPTFADYFAGAKEGVGSPIYRLVDGRWQQVTDPSGHRIRPHEAYWVFAQGQTDYQGPLEVRFGGIGALDFRTSADRLKVKLVNADPAASAVSVAIHPPAAGSSQLPLREVLADLDKLEASYPTLRDRVVHSALPSGTSESLKLTLERRDLSVAQQTALLKFSHDSGALVWVPVRARSGK